MIHCGSSTTTTTTDATTTTTSTTSTTTLMMVGSNSGGSNKKKKPYSEWTQEEKLATKQQNELFLKIKGAVFVVAFIGWYVVGSSTSS